MIEYRMIRELNEFEPILDVQREIWGFADIEIVPSRLFLISIKIGGQVIGAYDGERLIGYCFSLPGIRSETGVNYLHSHMLGVLPDYRNQGVGRRLKIEQRREALSRSIDLVEWTFDPLELKNAFLNIERLGVIIRRYIPNYYGVTTSKLHAGLPTDRLLAEWLLSAPRTEAILNRKARESGVIEERVEIPSSIAEIRRHDTRKAVEIQKDVKKKFTEYFARDLAVTGFEVTDGSCSYLLSKWQ